MAMELKEHRRVLALYRRMMDPASAPNEVRKARQALLDLLASYGKTEQDIEAVVAKAQEEVARAEAPPPPPPPPPDPMEEADRFNLLNLLLALIDHYVELTKEQRMAAALWI